MRISLLILMILAIAGCVVENSGPPSPGDGGPSELCYEDADDDLYGTYEMYEVMSPECHEGWTTIGGDCDDEDSDIAPDVEEICGDGIDNNCNGNADESCD
jgi:hypothetical protein